MRAALAESQVVRALSEGLVSVIRSSTHQGGAGGEGRAGAAEGPLAELSAALLVHAERAIEEERPRAKEEERRPRAKAGARR